MGWKPMNEKGRLVDVDRRRYPEKHLIHTNSVYYVAIHVYSSTCSSFGIH